MESRLAHVSLVHGGQADRWSVLLRLLNQAETCMTGVPRRRASCVRQSSICSLTAGLSRGNKLLIRKLSTHISYTWREGTGWVSPGKKYHLQGIYSFWEVTSDPVMADLLPCSLTTGEAWFTVTSVGCGEAYLWERTDRDGTDTRVDCKSEGIYKTLGVFPYI